MSRDENHEKFEKLFTLNFYKKKEQWNHRKKSLEPQTVEVNMATLSNNKNEISSLHNVGVVENKHNNSNNSSNADDIVAEIVPLSENATNRKTASARLELLMRCTKKLAESTETTSCEINQEPLHSHSQEEDLKNVCRDVSAANHNHGSVVDDKSNHSFNAHNIVAEIVPSSENATNRRTPSARLALLMSFYRSTLKESTENTSCEINGDAKILHSQDEDCCRNVLASDLNVGKVSAFEEAILKKCCEGKGNENGVRLNEGSIEDPHDKSDGKVEDVELSEYFHPTALEDRNFMEFHGNGPVHPSKLGFEEMPNYDAFKLFEVANWLNKKFCEDHYMEINQEPLHSHSQEEDLKNVCGDVSAANHNHGNVVDDKSNHSFNADNIVAEIVPSSENATNRRTPSARLAESTETTSCEINQEPLHSHSQEEDLKNVCGDVSAANHNHGSVVDDKSNHSFNADNIVAEIVPSSENATNRRTPSARLALLMSFYRSTLKESTENTSCEINGDAKILHSQDEDCCRNVLASDLNVGSVVDDKSNHSFNADNIVAEIVPSSENATNRRTPSARLTESTETTSCEINGDAIILHSQDEDCCRNVLASDLNVGKVSAFEEAILKKCCEGKGNENGVRLNEGSIEDPHDKSDGKVEDVELSEYFHPTALEDRNFMEFHGNGPVHPSKLGFEEMLNYDAFKLFEVANWLNTKFCEDHYMEMYDSRASFLSFTNDAHDEPHSSSGGNLDFDDSISSVDHYRLSRLSTRQLRAGFQKYAFTMQMLLQELNRRDAIRETRFRHTVDISEEWENNPADAFTYEPTHSDRITQYRQRCRFYVSKQFKSCPNLYCK